MLGIALIASSLTGGSAGAGKLCESAAVEDYLPPPPHGCERKRIEAVGNLSFGILHSAETLGLKAWERHVQMRFGQRFKDWKYAACKKVECTSATMEGSRRCFYSAYPCSPEVDLTLLEDLSARDLSPAASPQREARMEPPASLPPASPPGPAESPRQDPGQLTPEEIKEMQQRLADAGYRVLADGIFGEQTRRALIKWHQVNGLRANGDPSRENLEKLRARQNTRRRAGTF